MEGELDDEGQSQPVRVLKDQKHKKRWKMIV